jgi:hypothetical protein
MTPIPASTITEIVTLHNEYTEVNEKMRKTAQVVLDFIEQLQQTPSICSIELEDSMKQNILEAKNCIPKLWEIARGIVALVAPVLGDQESCEKISLAVYPDNRALQNAYLQKLYEKDFTGYLPRPIL